MEDNEKSIDSITKIRNINDISSNDSIYLIKPSGGDRDKECAILYLKSLFLGNNVSVEFDLEDSEFNITTGEAISRYLDNEIVNNITYVKIEDYEDSDVLAKLNNTDTVGGGVHTQFLDGCSLSTDGTLSGNHDTAIPTEAAITTYINSKEWNPGYYDVFIYNQSDFDLTFDGTALEDIKIFLVKNTYTLNNTIQLKSNVIIHSNGAIVNKGAVGIRFDTTYKQQNGFEEIIGDTLTVTSSTGFYVGDIVQLELPEKEYNTIKSIVNGTHIQLVTTPISGGSGGLNSMVTGIETKGWIFDGQGGVNGLPGNIVEGYVVGAFYIPYCANSSFEAEVRNFNNTSNGGGAYSGGGAVYNLKISNVHDCHANRGGGISFCNYSTISNVYNCIAELYQGGGIYDCSYSTISNVYNCHAIAGGGGGLYTCRYSTISNIHDCSASVGGGIYYCSYSIISNVYNCKASNGGGVRECHYSVISNVYNCIGLYNGGGVRECYYSVISNVYQCEAGYNGGGVYNSEYSVISNVYSCIASDDNGGGAYACYFCIYLGNWSNNTAPLNDNIYNGADSWGFAHDGSSNYLGYKTRATINWDASSQSN